MADPEAPPPEMPRPDLRPPLDRQPWLANALVTLRPLTEADWPALRAAAADPLIWAGHPARDRWRDSVFRAFFEDAQASGGALVVLDPVDGSMLGMSRFDLDRAAADEVEIGWTFLIRGVWGGGVNVAVKALMVAHALPSVERVIFLVGESNSRSCRALEKIGARLTRRQQEIVMAGTIIRHLVYAMDREDFQRSPLAALVPTPGF